MKDFNGAMLKEIRSKVAWTQAVLAAKIGVSISLVQKWEAGHPIKRRYWPAIASAALATPFSILVRQDLEVCFGENFVALCAVKSQEAA